MRPIDHENEFEADDWEDKAQAGSSPEESPDEEMETDPSEEESDADEMKEFAAADWKKEFPEYGRKNSRRRLLIVARSGGPARF